MLSTLTDENAFYELLPLSIRDDPAVASITEALKPTLQALNQAIPNILLISRLYYTAGLPAPDPIASIKRLIEFKGGLKVLSTFELEQLAWQWHVDFRKAALTDRALARLIIGSIQWHRIKGTPKSLYMALELCGFEGIIIEEDGEGVLWATYQLGFSILRTMDDVKRIVEICREMQPARCKLWRVYSSDADFRTGVYSGYTSRYSDCLYSDVSGVKNTGIPGLDDEHDLVIAFSVDHKQQFDTFWGEDVKAGVAMQEDVGYRILYRDSLRYGSARYGDKPIRNHSFVRDEDYGALLVDIIDGVDRLQTPFFMRTSTFGKSQGIYSEFEYSDINTRYSGGLRHLYTTLVYGRDRYSDSLIDTTVIVDEYTMNELGYQSAQRENFDAQVGVSVERGEHGVRHDVLSFGASRYGDDVIHNHGFVIEAELTGAWGAEMICTSGSWSGPWSGPWATLVALDRPYPEFYMQTTSIAWAQAVYGEKEYSDINTRYSGAYADEFTENALASTVEGGTDGTAQLAIDGERGVQTVALHNESWSGDWGEEPWCPYIAYLTVSSEEE